MLEILPEDADIVLLAEALNEERPPEPSHSALVPINADEFTALLEAGIRVELRELRNRSRES